MATLKWLGNIGTFGDWSVAANWSTGSVPVNNDKVIFTGESDVPVTAGLSQIAIDLDLLFIGEDFTKDIGTDGDPLIISTDRVVHLGKGTLHYDNSSLSISPDTTDEFIVAHTGSVGVLAASIKGGKYGTIAVARGRVEIVDMANSISLILTHVDNRSSDANVTVLKTTTQILDVRMSGGLLTLKGNSDVIDFYITDGTLVNESTAIAPTALRMFSGLVDWNSGQTLSRVELYGGLLDFTRSTEEKTITTLFQFPDARFEYLPDLTTFTKVDMDGLTSVEG